MKKILMIVAALSLIGCAPEVERMAVTPSGRPEVSFATSNTASVADKLTNLCAGKGLLVQNASSSEVVCGGQMQGGDAILAQMLIGNSYSTTPELFVKFVIFKNGATVRVQAYQWMQTQMAFGQVRKSELNGNAQFNVVLKALISIGGTPVTTS